eukprot:6642039-Pyramimonas_sp.AAC.1
MKALALKTSSLLFSVIPQRWIEFTKHVISATETATDNVKLLSWGVFESRQLTLKMMSLRTLYFRECISMYISGPERVTDTDYQHVMLWAYESQQKLSQFLESSPKQSPEAFADRWVTVLAMGEKAKDATELSKAFEKVVEESTDEAISVADCGGKT